MAIFKTFNATFSYPSFLWPFLYNDDFFMPSAKVESTWCDSKCCVLTASPCTDSESYKQLFELFQKRVPGGFGVTTTGGGVNLTVSVTQIPTKRNTFYCHFKAHMVCAKLVAVWAFEISMCQTHTIDYCSSWMIWLHLVNKHYFLKLPFH